MPQEWIEALAYAASQGSDLLALEAIAKIPQDRNELAVCLLDLVDGFRFDIIVEASKAALASHV